MKEYLRQTGKICNLSLHTDRIFVKIVEELGVKEPSLSTNPGETSIDSLDYTSLNSISTL